MRYIAMFPGPWTPTFLYIAYFKALSVSRYEILNKLHSPNSVIDLWMGDATGDKLSEAWDTLDHAMAVEILGLQQEDYVILTKQAFYSDKCLPASTRMYEEWIGYQGVAKYWGFDSSATMTGTEGLTLIMKLLSLSGLNFTELLVLLKQNILMEGLLLNLTSLRSKSRNSLGSWKICDCIDWTQMAWLWTLMRIPVISSSTLCG